MALNLVRNSKVFFTTNVDADGTVPRGGYGQVNTYEIQVLDGFSFSQNTNTETITLNESGASPVRGQRTFNTSLAPVDFSFSTYIKLKNEGTRIVADESVLWNALFTSEGIKESQRILIGTGGTGTISSVGWVQGTGQVAITGSGLPGTATLPVGSIVSISGLTATSGYPSALINGYGAVNTSSATNINITVTPASTASATSITTPTNLVLTRQNISQTTILGTGGTGTVSGVTYTASSGNLTIAGSALPTTSVTAGSIVTISGLGAPAVTGCSVEQICQAAYVSSSSATSIVLQLASPPTGTVTLTTTTITINESAWTENSTNFSYVSTAASDRQKLQPFGILFLIDNVIYGVDNCALNQASIDFAIDGIATIAWTGQGTSLRRLSASTTDSAGASAGTFTGTSIYGRYTTSTPDCSYLTNKLSTLSLKAVNQYLRLDATTAVTAGETYALALTGGNININNNITYLTPAILGTVNKPATYFQGTRAVTGSLNAYLKTGSSDDAGTLLADMLDAARANPEIMMNLVVSIGGPSNPKVVLDMPSAVTTVPSVEVQQLVSTTLNFTAEGSKTGAPPATFDLQEHNDLSVRYYAT